MAASQSTYYAIKTKVIFCTTSCQVDRLSEASPELAKRCSSSLHKLFTNPAWPSVGHLECNCDKNIFNTTTHYLHHLCEVLTKSVKNCKTRLVQNLFEHHAKLPPVGHLECNREEKDFLHYYT